MIQNKEYLTKHISKWLADEAADADAKTLVVGVSGGVDSAVVAALCAYAGRDHGLAAVGVIMPCHSSEASFIRGQEVIKAFGLKKFIVDLSKSFGDISGQAGFPSEDLPTLERKIIQGSLRSCLRAPVLDYITKLEKGLIIGTSNLSEDGWYDQKSGRGTGPRYFQKRGDGLVDNSPISGLFKSEVYDLAEYLGVPKSILDATPTADLWGPDGGHTDEGELGLTYDQVEEAMREVIYWPEEKVFDLTKLKPNALRLFGMEQETRHKWNPNLPAISREDLMKKGLVDTLQPVA